MQHRKFQNVDVKNTFDSYPKKIREKLLVLRETIFQTAEADEYIGEIEETLKWENPSYLTHKPKSGTTIRLSRVKEHHDKYAISVHCQTSLISEFKAIYPDLNYDKNRSIIFDIHSDLPYQTIKHFISSALTYHYRKKQGFGL